MTQTYHGENTRARYIIYCNDYAMAANYATKQRWDMSQWRHLYDDVAPGKVVVFERQKEKDSATI
jgi:hypothetical protein